MRFSGRSRDSRWDAKVICRRLSLSLDHSTLCWGVVRSHRRRLGAVLAEPNTSAEKLNSATSDSLQDGKADRLNPITATPSVRRHSDRPSHHNSALLRRYRKGRPSTKIERLTLQCLLLLNNDRTAATSDRFEIPASDRPNLIAATPSLRRHSDRPSHHNSDRL